MKIEICPYQLFPLTQLNRLTKEVSPRAGHLLAMEIEGVWGFADFFAWPELGDAPLEVELDQPSTHLKAAIEWMKFEIQAKKKQELLVHPLDRFENHCLITDLLGFTEKDLKQKNAEGFLTFKAKMGHDFEKEKTHLEALYRSSPQVKWRLDFNLFFPEGKSALDFLETCSDDFLAAIDFCEDLLPYRFFPIVKSKFPRLRLAVDRECQEALDDGESLADVFILKAAHFSPTEIKKLHNFPNKDFVVTSYMGHPLDIVISMSLVKELQKKFPSQVKSSGLLTYLLYENTPYHICFHNHGPSLSFTALTQSGWGLDPLLGQETWGPTLAIYQSSSFKSETLPEDFWASEESALFVSPFWKKNNVPFFHETLRHLPKLDKHLWIMTSGTTSNDSTQVKWIALSKEAMLTSAHAVNAHLHSNEKDCWLHALPPFHVGGLGILARAHLSQAKVVSGVQEKWNPDFFMEQLHLHQATLSALVPTQIYDLIQKGFKAPHHLRAVIVGGDKLDPDLYLKARALDWPLLPSYGMSECASQVATADLQSLKGLKWPTLKILSHAKLTLVDEFITIESKSLFTCLLEAAPQSYVLKHSPQQLITKDLGKIRDSSLVVLGRADQQVKILGEKVHLNLVEEKIKKLMPHTDIIIIPVDDPRRGQNLVAVMETLPLPELTELNKGLTSLEQISKIIKVDHIPRGELGKIKRAQLKKQMEDLHLL